MVFFRGKFRHVSSSDSDDDEDGDKVGAALKPPPDLTGQNTGVQLLLGAGCLALGALLTLMLMGVVILAQRTQQR
jgi:hypothetical protein